MSVRHGAHKFTYFLMERLDKFPFQMSFSSTILITIVIISQLNDTVNPFKIDFFLLFASFSLFYHPFISFCRHFHLCSIIRNVYVPLCVCVWIKLSTIITAHHTHLIRFVTGCQAALVSRMIYDFNHLLFQCLLMNR